jgi:hypothetical protein
VCCSHLLLQYFGALTSLLHRSLLSPCHLVWPGWMSPGCCGPVARLVTVTWWHAALQLQPSSYNFKLMIGKLEGGDWPLSPRGQGWALYVRMGCVQNFGRPRGETLARADLRVYDYHCLPVALIWVKSLSQRIGPSHSQRSWELRINSRKHFKLGQELSFEECILAINQLIFPK